MTPTRAIVYCRQSRTEAGKESTSLSQQQTDGVLLVEKNGWKLVTVLVDADRSGALMPKQWSTGRGRYREGLTKLIQLVEAGEVDVVVARKMDRLSRAKLEISLKLLSLLDAKKVRLAFTHENSPDLSSSSGELQVSMLLAFARFEQRKIRDNVKAAKDYLKKIGRKYVACNSYGYRDGDKKDVVIHPEEAEIVKMMYRLYIGGESVRKIRNLLNEQYAGKTRSGAKWSSMVVGRILCNPQYIGKRYEGTELVDFPIYQPILDEETWYKSIRRMKSRETPKGYSVTNHYTISGFIKCASCGEKLEIHSQRGVRYRVYACNTPNCKCRAARVSSQEYEILAKRYLSKRFRVTTVEENKSSYAVSLIRDNMNETAKLYATGEVDLETFKLVQSTGNAKIQALLNEESKVSTKEIPWDEATVEERREFIRELNVDILVGKDKLVINWHGEPEKYKGEWFARRPEIQDEVPLSYVRRPTGQKQNSWLGNHEDVKVVYEVIKPA